MFTRSNPSKSCRICALALAVPLGYFALAATGADRAAAESSSRTLADEKDQSKAGPHQEQVDAIVKAYLDVQKLLAQDKLEGIQPQLTKVRESAETLIESEDSKLSAQAKTVAKHAAIEPKTLKEARGAFKPLSAGVIGLVQIIPPTTEAAPALYEATCPMAKANWLQTTKDVANPYMGKAMLECGTIEQTIKAPAGDKNAGPKAQNSNRDAAASSGMACCAAPAR